MSDFIDFDFEETTVREVREVRYRKTAFRAEKSANQLPPYAEIGGDGNVRIFTPFNHAYVDALKGDIPHEFRTYDRDRKCWVVDYERRRKAIRVLRRYFPGAPVIEIGSDLNPIDTRPETGSEPQQLSPRERVKLLARHTRATQEQHDYYLANRNKDKAERTPLKPIPLSPERAFGQATPIVLKRDNGVCQYCSAPAAHVDQWNSDQLPSPDNMVACCLSCRIEGKGRYFLTLEQKRTWITKQREDPAPTPQHTKNYSPWARGKDQVMGRYKTRSDEGIDSA